MVTAQVIGFSFVAVRINNAEICCSLWLRLVLGNQLYLTVVVGIYRNYPISKINERNEFRFKLSNY